MNVACWRFVFAAMLLVAASAAADEFDDYRIPKHDLIDWRAQLGLDAAQIHLVELVSKLHEVGSGA